MNGFELFEVAAMLINAGYFLYYRRFGYSPSEFAFHWQMEDGFKKKFLWDSCFAMAPAASWLLRITST